MAVDLHDWGAMNSAHDFHDKDFHAGDCKLAREIEADIPNSSQE